MKSAQRSLALLLAIVLSVGLIPAQTVQVCATETAASGAVDKTDGDIDVPVTGEDETDPSEGTDTTQDDAVLTVTPARSEVCPGDELTLTVSLSGGNALTSLGYIPVTDSAAFEVIGGEVLPAGMAAELWDFTAADGGLLYCSAAVVIDGGVFSFTVRVKEDAPAGEYAVTEAAAISCGSSNVAFTLNDAAITVTIDPAKEIVAQGTCGDDLTWILNGEGTLTVSGTGTMYGYGSAFCAPWYDQRNTVRTVVIESGVTGIGDHAFDSCEYLTAVDIPASVVEIGSAVFSSCFSLERIGVAQSSEYYCSDTCGVLYNKDKTTLMRAPCVLGGSYEIPDRVTNIAAGAFEACGSLTDVYYTGTVAQWRKLTVGENNDPLLAATLHTADDKYCAHCDKAVAWAEWTGITAPASGHYYLSGDLSNDQTEYLLIAEAADVVLDLCGYVYTAENGALFQINGSLSIMDSAEGGTLTASERLTPETSSPVLYITGEGGTLNLYNGTVSGGTAACGGNIYAEKNAGVNLLGGTVTGGKAALSGGNICLIDGAVLIIDGCTVSEGKADLGGNIAAYSGSCFAVISGTVTGGTANDGGNIYAVGSSESTTLFGVAGGNVTGDAVIRAYSAVYLEGAPVVTKGSVSGLALAEGVLITLGELTEGASVAVNATGVFTEASDNAADYAAYFTSADSAYRIIAENGTLSCQRSYLDTEFAIVAQPASAEITAGFVAQFTVEAANVASYRWQYRRNENASWVNTTLSGYKTATLSVPVLLGRDGYQYRCRVTGSDGAVLYTEPAMLTVNDSIIINTQPTRQIVGVDTNATFTVAAEGVGLTYQWQYRKNSDGSWMVTGMSGNATDTLTVPALLSRNGYQYRCAITDGNGIKIYSGVATLSAIGFTEHPADQTVAVNTDAVFTVAAKGQELTYQWQYRKSETGNWMTTGLNGNKTDTLTVLALATRNGYQYRCAITDALGIIRYSDPATLTVE